jgi:transcriptional regulator with XRE-family HTH domain
MLNAIIVAHMSDLSFKSPQELQIELGKRVRQLRLSRNLGQRATAEKAGISHGALRTLEAGQGSSVQTFLRTLKALDFLQGIEMLAPEPTVSPLAMVRTSKTPQRVRRSHRLQKDSR